MKVLPAIDLMNGEVVRLRKGRFDEKTVYGSDPLAVAAGFRAAGARYLHVVDLDGTRDGAGRQGAALARMAAESGLRVQVGGGVRTQEDVQAHLDSGAEAVVVGSLAARDPVLCEHLLRHFGGERIRLALDCRLDAEGVPRILTGGWSTEEHVSVFALLERYRDAGLRSILCTDVERDGTLEGPNLGLYRRLKERSAQVEVIASGGVGTIEDVLALRDAGLEGVIVGRALYEGALEISELIALETRPC